MLKIERKNLNKKSIMYITGGKELLDFIETLWEKLNKYHMNKSIHFKERFKNFRFKDKRENIEKDKEKKTFIILAKDITKDKYIGYVIAFVWEDNVGEINSIYVDNKYRGLKIGDKLMKESLDWIRSNGVNTISIGVASGNEEVLRFYAKYGFFPKMITLEISHKNATRRQEGTN